MKSLLSVILAITLLAGCSTLNSNKPAVVYQTQEVKTAVAVFPPVPEVAPFESRVLQLNDDSPDGVVGQSYKIDWLSLMYRDRIFTDFLTQYRKAKENAEATK